MKLQGFLINKDFLFLVMWHPCRFMMLGERLAHDSSYENIPVPTLSAQAETG